MISESVIVGTLLYGKEQLTHIALNSVKGHHFNGTYTRIIFEACQKCEKDFGRITEDAVLQEAQAQLDKSYLKDYRQYRADTLKEIEGHCQKVVDAYTRERIITGLDNIVLDASEYEDSRQLITDTEHVISDSADEVGMPGLTLSEMKERDANQPRYEKLYTGDPFWDQTFFKHGGFHKGQMTTIFGDSKHGKSMAALMFSRLLIDQGYSGLYTSFEDVDRFYAEHVEKGLQNKENIENFIVTDHSQGCSTLEDITTTAKYHKSKNDIVFLVVDNAQIVGVDGLKTWDETQRLVTISPRLSKLAIELDILVLQLSQISNQRSQAHGYDRQPKTHDIYGSGQIRKDSFMTISVFKPSEVEELLITNDHTGEVRGVKHPSGGDEDMWPLSTVLLKQDIVRKGEKYWKNVILNITEDGLFRPVEEKQEAPF